MLDTRPLRSTTFRRVAAGYWINELGNMLGDIALLILVFDRTRSPLATATLLIALRFLPAIAAPLLTTRVEALPIRATLTTIYLLEASCFAAIALLTHAFRLPPVLVLAALDGMLAITARALTRSVTAAALRPDDLLREGNAILNMGMTATTAVGPVLAGLLVAAAGAGTALFVNAGSFAAVALIIVTTRHLRVESDLDLGMWGRLRAGRDAVRSSLTVGYLLGGAALVLMLASIAMPIEVIFAKQTLHAGDAGFGYMLGSWGVGMIAGGAAFAVASQLRLMVGLAASVFLIAIGYLGLAVSPTLAIACGFSALIGVGNGYGWIATVTAIQESIPATTMGAVMAVLEAISWLMPAVGFVIGGVVTALSSPRAAYAVSGAGVAVVLVAAMLWPRPRFHRGRGEVVFAPVPGQADGGVQQQAGEVDGNAAGGAGEAPPAPPGLHLQQPTTTAPGEPL